jgi:hypothetical protein
MPRFLAVYMMQQANVARFRSLPKAEQEAIDAVGIARWQAWEARNAAAILERGGMVGRTLRVTTGGTAAAANQICGYLVVEAEDAEAAARLFQDHPHITVFPGDSVDIMPFVT